MGQALYPAALAPSVALAVMQTGSAVSLAALVFVGDVADGLARATTTFVVGSVLAGAVYAWRTGFEVVVAGAKNNVTVVIAGIAAGVAANVEGDAADTVLVFVAIAALLSGGLMYVIGRLGMGNLMRFLPFPVIGGYLAGTAWLMVKGGLSVMVDRPLELGRIGELAEWQLAKLWLPGVLLAMVVVFMTAGRQSLTIVGAVSGFHVLVWMFGSHPVVEADGWVLGPLPRTEDIAALVPDPGAIEWSAIGTGAVGLVAIALISLISLLLDVTGTGYATGEDVDLNRELRASGLASLASGAVGGTVGFVGVGQTMLARRLRASSVLVVAAFVTIATVTVATGPWLVGWMPRFVAGALVMGPGIILGHRWFIDSIVNAQLADRLIAVIIPLTVASVGILEGVGLGVAVSAAIFVVRYASIDPVRSEVSGRVLRSAIDRSTDEQAVLEEHGHRVVVLSLGGFLFFGSVSKLTRRVRELVSQDVTDCIVDFRRVSGIDSSAEAELAKLSRLCEDNSVRLYIAGPTVDIGRALRRRHLVKELDERVHPDVDHALEAAESKILDAIDRTPGAVPGIDLSSEPLDAVLDRYVTRHEVPAGAELITTGSASGDLFMIHRGSFTVWADDDGRRRRIRRVTAGTFVGEMGFFTSAARSATVTADCDSVVLRMTRDRFRALTVAQPDVAIDLAERLLAVNSKRLDAANAAIRDLLR